MLNCCPDLVVEQRKPWLTPRTALSEDTLTSFSRPEANRFPTMTCLMSNTLLSILS